MLRVDRFLPKPKPPPGRSPFGVKERNKVLTFPQERRRSRNRQVLGEVPEEEEELLEAEEPQDGELPEAEVRSAVVLEALLGAELVVEGSLRGEADQGVVMLALEVVAGFNHCELPCWLSCSKHGLWRWRVYPS